MSIQKNLIWTALFSATLGLTACGGGSGDTASDGGTATVSGTVADGYLANATVCLDLNLNKLCDANEPFEITATDGTYSFEATAAQIASAPILAMVTTDTTDSDTGMAVAKPYTLSAPIGKPAFVSPVSSMIQSKLELNPSMTPEQAEAGVKADLGITSGTVDLYKDFIAAGESGETDAADYKVLHQTAQVVARVMATFTETLNATLGLAPEDVNAIQLLVAKAVTAQLPTIYSSAKTYLEDPNNHGEVSFAFSDDLATTVKDNDTSIDSIDRAKFNASKEEFALLDKSESITAVEVIDAGGAVFMTLGTAGSELVIDTMAMLTDGFYRAMVNVNSLRNEELTSAAEVVTRLKEEIPKPLAMTKNADGSVSFSSPNGNKIGIYTVSQVSLAGKTIKLDKVIADYDGTNTVTFSEGDVSYQFAVSETYGLNLANIETKDFTDLCMGMGTTEKSTCEKLSNEPFSTESGTTTAGGYGSYTFDYFYDHPEIRADVIKSWYSKDKAQLHSYMKNTTTTPPEAVVAVCKYELEDPALGDYEPLRDGNGVVCQPNTEITLGAIKTGNLADNTRYMVIPQTDDSDNGLAIAYEIFTSYGGIAYELYGEFALDGSPKIISYKPFNVSAAKSIIKAFDTPAE